MDRLYSRRQERWMEFYFHSILQAFTCRKYIANQEWGRWNGVRTFWDADKYRSGAGRRRVFDTCTGSPSAGTQRRQRKTSVFLYGLVWRLRHPTGPHAELQARRLEPRFTRKVTCKAPPSQTWTTAWDISLVQKPANRLPATVWYYQFPLSKLVSLLFSVLFTFYCVFFSF